MLDQFRFDVDGPTARAVFALRRVSRGRQLWRFVRSTTLVAGCLGLCAVLVAGVAHAQFRGGTFSSYGHFTSSTSTASAHTTTMTSTVANEIYFDPYEGCDDEARVEAIDFATPDPDDLLVRAGEPWAAGEELFVDLVVSRCTRVSSFLYDGIELWQTDGGVDGRSYHVRQVSTRTVSGMTNIRLALTHAHLGHGLRNRVLVELTQPRTGRVSTRLLHVNWVKAVNGNAELAILEEDVLNSMLASLYETFGDDGRAPIDENESWFLHDPALERCTPADLGDRGCLRAEIVEDVGVRFSVEMKLELAYFCDPKIRASGAVAYVPGAEGGFEPEWVEDLDVQVNVPGLCTLLTGILPTVIGQEIAEALVTDMVEQRITPLLEQDVDCGDGCGFAGAPVYLDGEIRVPITPFLSHVTIGVPYRAKNPDHRHWGENLHLAADQQVLLIPGGSALTCYEQSGSAQGCTFYRVGAAGLENFRAEARTVPDPWELFGQRWVYFPFRQAIRDQMRLPDRFLENLPAPGSGVGAQLARTLDSPFIREVSTPCRMPAPVVDRAIGFSPNDRWDRDLGTLDREVTMVFLDLSESDVESIPLCPVAGDTRPALIPETSIGTGDIGIQLY